ncbi:MAG: hypothetical protein K0S75_2259 [Clostridia bacterium]|jgi:hypothetical protein|nr:hypothetical protein [Clostridia bacterium]
MQKRSESTKREKVFFRTKLKHTAIVVLCIFFALSTIYAVDISTYKLKENEYDQYAFRVTRASENIMRIDIVGNKYNLDIQRMRTYAEKVTVKTKALFTNLQNKLR